MILIADSGSTKTDWCLINRAGEDIFFTTVGINPYYAESTRMIDSIRLGIPRNIDAMQIDEVHFYGAGCQEDNTEVMEALLRTVFPNASRITANLDLLAAARGLLGRKAGFAAILGTGTNTCIYDGEKIVHNIDSLGFLLGDEGSGASIGKKVLSDFLRYKMPDAVRRVFIDTYRLSPAEIMNKVYKEPYANRFCAGFARFLKQPAVDEAYSYRLVKTCFEEFFANLVAAYPGYSNYTFNCIGSIGYHFKEILLEVMQAHSMKPGRILSSLVQELANYHKGSDSVPSQ